MTATEIHAPGAVITLRGVEKLYRPGLFRRSVAALRGLDLSVAPGEIHGLIGPNGAGKTTAFRILLGILRPTGGEGELFGRPLGDRESRRSLGFLPELPAYPPHLTAGELLRFARALSGIARDDRSDARLLGELGLEGFEQRSIRRLSKGQVQRVGLAQCLVHSPRLLILDEPMSGLDPVGRALVRDRLRLERAQGRTILLSSHVLADIEALADTVSLVAGGRRLAVERPRDLLAGAAAAVVLEGSGPLPDGLIEVAGNREVQRTPAGEWIVRMSGSAPEEVERCIRRVLDAGCRITRLETARPDLERMLLDRLSLPAESDERSPIRRASRT